MRYPRLPQLSSRTVWWYLCCAPLPCTWRVSSCFSSLHYTLTNGKKQVIGLVNDVLSHIEKAMLALGEVVDVEDSHPVTVHVWGFSATAGGNPTVSMCVPRVLVVDRCFISHTTVYHLDAQKSSNSKTYTSHIGTSSKREPPGCLTLRGGGKADPSCSYVRRSPRSGSRERRSVRSRCKPFGRCRRRLQSFHRASRALGLRAFSS